jgi:hypothetical protein
MTIRSTFYTSKTKQGGHYTHNVTLKCIRLTIVAVQWQWWLHIMSVFVDLGTQREKHIG